MHNVHEKKTECYVIITVLLLLLDFESTVTTELPAINQCSLYLDTS